MKQRKQGKVGACASIPWQFIMWLYELGLQYSPMTKTLFFGHAGELGLDSGGNAVP